MFRKIRMMFKPSNFWPPKKLLLLILLLAAMASFACGNDEQTSTATTVPTPNNTSVGQIGAMLQLPNIADTVARVRPAVVSILTEVIVRDRFGRQRSSFGSGTGVIFDDSGLVFTNNHVIEGGVKITVTLDNGTQEMAEVVAAELVSDLAVLQLPGDGYQALSFQENGGLRVGDWVIAIGNALALPGGPTVTVGVVSALGRSIEASEDVTLHDLIQTDTTINPGNSGGPLIDLSGSLVGINTAVLRGTSAGGGGVAVEGIGFAISSETAKQIAEQLVEFGHVRWAWMGVFLADLVPEIAAEVGLPIQEGVIIQTTVIDGPSDRAGIQAGDIVVNIGGHDIATVSDLTRLLKQEFDVGQEVEVEVYRMANDEGERKTLTLEFGERPR